MNPRIDVEYQTLTLPPPYAYAYSLQAELTEQSVAVTLDWRYTDRDELSDEEIWEEGFTSDDDFRWSGSLPEAWKSALSELLDQTKLLPEKSLVSEHSDLRVTLTNTHAQSGTGIPDDPQQWEYQLQELVQGVYEAAQRERPLRIRYLDISQPDKLVAITMNISFLHRRFTVTTERTSRTHTQKLPWDRVHLLMENVYLPDYNFEESSEEHPKAPGQYIDPGDEQWYRWGKSVSNPGKADVLSTLKKMINEMGLPK